MPAPWRTTAGSGMPCRPRCWTRRNGLPKELRAQIAGVAMAVLRECAAEQPDLEFVAEMNDHFAAALWR